MFTKYKGHQTYFCTAVMITPCSAVVLDICRCTLYSKKELLQTGIVELDSHSLPFLIYSWWDAREVEGERGRRGGE